MASRDLPHWGDVARSVSRTGFAGWGLAFVLTLFTGRHVWTVWLSVAGFGAGVLAGVVWLVAEFREGARGPAR